MIILRHMKMKGVTLSQFAAMLLGLLVVACFPAGCTKKSEPAQPPIVATSSPKPQTPFERDLDFVRQGQFIHVFVFSRKDGATFNPEDITYLKANSPPETNQWVSTEGGRRVIAGTNFEFKQEHFDALTVRFNIENLSGK